MAYTVNKVSIWSGEIEDRVGGLAAKLEALAEAGVDLEVVVARRQAHLPGKGLVLLGPIKGAKGKAAATAAGLSEVSEVALRVEGPNKPGEGSRLARLLADAGINLRGLAATVSGAKVVISLGFDNEADADHAGRLLRAAGARRK
jgi:hypothetical protein